jgi:hypothetical protein
VAGLPAVGLLIARLVTDAGPRGLFQADLVALVLAVACGAFAVRTRRLVLVAVPAGAVAVAFAHAAVAGTFDGALALALLELGVVAAASGLAAVGRAVGTPALTAGAVSAAVLWLAMTGLLWADSLAETLPPARQFRFRQAVLHLDVATACAYDVARFDRLHDPRVYREVPLAASLVRAPTAGPTGAAWLVVGLLAWGMAGWVGAGRGRGTSAPA